MYGSVEIELLNHGGAIRQVRRDLAIQGCSLIAISLQSVHFSRPFSQKQKRLTKNYLMFFGPVRGSALLGRGCLLAMKGV
eukprot:2128502-Amphidinium_carterae.1